MKKFSKKLIKFVIFAFVILFSSQAGAANFKGLSFMGNYVESHPTTIHVFKPFIEKTKEFSKGEVTFDYFADGILYSSTEAYAVLDDGRVDFGTIKPSMFEGRMKFSTVVDLPYIAQNAIVGALVVSEIINLPEVAAEFPKNSVPFSAWTAAAYQITSIKPIKSLADLKGKTIIAWNINTFEILKLLGANPIRINPPDTYLSLSKGMADGVMCAFAGVRPFKIAEVATHHFILNLGAEPFQMLVHKPLWDDFSPEMQKFFIEEGGANFAFKVGKSLEDGQKIDFEFLKKHGHEYHHPSDEDKAALREILLVCQENWIKKLPIKDQEKGREILKLVNERAEYYQSEFEKGTYGEY